MRQHKVYNMRPSRPGLVYARCAPTEQKRVSSVSVGWEGGLPGAKREKEGKR